MGADPFTAAMFAGSTIMNADAQSQAQKQQKKQYNSTNALFNSLKPEVRNLYAKAMRSSAGGYDAAMAKLQGAGQKAKAGIARSGVQQNAAATDSAISRGLYGSSYLDSLHRGIGADTAQGIAGIDEGTATMLAQLMQQKGTAAANLFTGQAGNLSSITANQAGIQSNYQFSPGQPIDMLGWAKLFNSGGGGSGVSGMPDWMLP